MQVCERVLAAVDVSAESTQVVETAAAIAAAFDAELHIVHVVEPSSLSYGTVMQADLHSHEMGRMWDHARAHVAELGNRLEVPSERQHVVTGRAISEIHRMAEAHQTDLIVVGSHGRHGLGLLLGSTANGVLHGAIATCSRFGLRRETRPRSLHRRKRRKPLTGVVRKQTGRPAVAKDRIQIQCAPFGQPLSGFPR